MFKWNKLGLLAGGFLCGTYGVKILGSQDAKKVYTGVTAGVLRMKDQVLKDVTNLRENCEDIVAEAKECNEALERAYEAKLIEDAKAVLAEAEAKAAEA